MMRPILFASSLILAVLLPARAPAQAGPKERLEKSPRHHEWVAVKKGDRTVHAFLVFPEVKEKALAVIVIHENRGLTDWVRSVADRLAEAGYIAIAPDLLSGSGPKKGKTSDFASEDDARKAIYDLKPDQVMSDLDIVADHVAKLPAASGKVAVAGFCWGGGQAFSFAGRRKDLAAAFVFYGTGPDSKEAVEKIACPVHGFYGGNDARINATVPGTAELMKAAGKTFETSTYEGAGHGFLRAGEEPGASPANRRAFEEAWRRWKDVLEKIAKKA
jgi:carboxymethylenebutenolidase